MSPLTDELVASGPATPFPRLASAMFSSSVGVLIALFTPLQLLLTLKLTAVAGESAVAAFGVVTGAGALCALVAGPVAGRISDRTAVRFGRRRTWILTGALLGSLVVFAGGFATTGWQVGLAWCAMQVIFNFQIAATNALLADQVPAARRSTVSGFLGLALAVGPLLGIAAVSGLSSPVAQWGIVAGISAFAGVLAVVLLRDPRHTRYPGRPGLNVRELVKSFWLNPRNHPAFGWAWLVRFSLYCAYSSSTYNAFFVMSRFGVAPGQVGRVVLVMSALVVGLLAITSVVAGLISDRVRRQKPFVIAAGLLAAGGLVLMTAATTLGAVYGAMAMLGIAMGQFVAIDNAICIRMLPNEENVGRDLGIINLASTLPQSVVPFIAPFLLYLGGFPMFYGTLAVIACAGAAVVFHLPEIGREGDPRWAVITRAGTGA
jgi:MFS family permease